MLEPAGRGVWAWALSARPPGQSLRQDRLGAGGGSGPEPRATKSARVYSRRAPERRAEGRSRALVGGSALCAASGGKTLGRAGCRRERRTEAE